jgi:hypothetical protein
MAEILTELPSDMSGEATALAALYLFQENP